MAAMPPFTGTRSHTQVAPLPTVAPEANNGTRAAIQAIRDLFARDGSETPVQETSAIIRQAWERLRESHERALRRDPGLKHFPFWVSDNLRRSTIERVILSGYNEDMGTLRCSAGRASERLGVERWELILYFGEFKRLKARILGKISNKFQSLEINELYHDIRECQQARRSQNARLGPNPPPYYEFVNRDFEIYLERRRNRFHFINHAASIQQTYGATDDEDDDDENDFDSDRLPDGESDGESPNERHITINNDENEYEYEHENNVGRDKSGGQEINDERDRQLSQQIIHENQRANYYLEIQQMDNQDYLEDIDQTNVEAAPEGATVGNPPLLQEAINRFDTAEPTVAARQVTVPTSVPTPPISIFDGASSEIDNVPPPAIGQGGGSNSIRWSRAKSATVDREFEPMDSHRQFKEEKSFLERQLLFASNRVKSSESLINSLNETRRADESTRNMLRELQNEANVIAECWKTFILSEDFPTAETAVRAFRPVATSVEEIHTKRRRRAQDLTENKAKRVKIMAELRSLARTRENT